jgi:hypothetical protein
MKFTLIIFILVVSVYLFCCNQLELIPFTPYITPVEWCENQPCITIQQITIVQPSSTVFVYLLGVIAIIIGIYLLRTKGSQKFVCWWGFALLLWGIGALLAGTSYQAFSYEIKCDGRATCIWTSLWEIYYLIFTVGSVNAMLLAQAEINEGESLSKVMEGYAYGNFILYIILVVIGSIIPVQFLISFELMIILLAPTILFLLLFNIRKYLVRKEKIHLSFVIIWLGLILIIGLYFLYYILGITEILWESRIWFSENDVLHITLIAWMFYIYFAIKRY